MQRFATSISPRDDSSEFVEDSPRDRLPSLPQANAMAMLLEAIQAVEMVPSFSSSSVTALTRAQEPQQKRMRVSMPPKVTSAPLALPSMASLRAGLQLDGGYVPMQPSPFDYVPAQHHYAPALPYTLLPVTTFTPQTCSSPHHF
jgi:hypothetical protein